MSTREPKKTSEPSRLRLSSDLLKDQLRLHAGLTAEQRKLLTSKDR